MINLHKLESAGKEIERRLIVIRKGVNADVGAFNVAHKEITIIGKDLQALAINHPSEPIIKKGEFYLVYIRDHDRRGSKNEHDWDIQQNPAHCFLGGNKVHFYFCRTLTHMKMGGRFMRYRQILWKFDDNTKIIDLSDASGVETRLPWCKNCLGIFLKKNWWSLPNKDIMAQNGDSQRLIKDVMAQNGDSQRLMAAVKAYYLGNRDSGKEYSDDFREHAQQGG